MDRMQRTTLFCGIAVIVLNALYPIKIHGYRFLLVPYFLRLMIVWSWGQLLLWSIIIAIVTGGLIYLQRQKNEKPKDGRKE